MFFRTVKYGRPEPEWVPLHESGAHDDIGPVYDGVKPLFIVHEDDANAILAPYNKGCYVFFVKDDNLHLLAKTETGIQQFSIYTKFTRPSKKFNLKNENGDFVFPAPGILKKSLRDFLSSPEVIKLFSFQLNLTEAQMWAPLKVSIVPPLQAQLLKHFVMQDGLSKLPLLTPPLQEVVLFNFVATFISDLDYKQDCFKSFIQANLLNLTTVKLSHRTHYSTDGIKRNLNCLRELYKNGCMKAGLVLAAIVNSGICKFEDMQKNKAQLGAYSLRVISGKNIKPLFCDLEEYREITQNPEVIEIKVLRDLCLIRYGQACKNQAIIDSTLIQLDVINAIKFI